jgi:hypothetical protein
MAETIHKLTAIVPCNDLDTAERFFTRLGFTRFRDSPEDYRIMRDIKGAEVHLNPAVEGWLVPNKNPFGLYLYTEDVDSVVDEFKDTGEIVSKEKKAENKPWGMYEVSINGPDDLLVRVGYSTRLRNREGKEVISGNAESAK